MIINNKLLDNIKAKHIAILLAVVYFVVGLMVFTQYGISYDEEVQRIENGGLNYKYIMGDKESLRQGNEKYHGPAFELVLTGIEKAVNFSDLRQVYHMRHFVNFLVFFLSVLALYFLAKRVFGSDKVGLFGALVYSLSPRFFAEAFYNSKDIIFLAFFTFALYTLFRFVQKSNIKWALLHALATGFLIDVRILGLLIPIATIGVLIYKHLLLTEKGSPVLKPALSLAVYLIVQFGAMVLFWPILWEGPFHHLKEAFLEMSHYHWFGYAKYWGKLLNERELPWHYLPVWMAITIPVIFQFFALLGAGFTITKILPFSKSNHKKYLFDFLFLALFLGPLILIILMKSVVYDGWRHLYFLYVPFVLLACRGGIVIWHWLKPIFVEKYKRFALVSFFIIAFIGPLYNIVIYHPYQYVYFNTIATSFFYPLEKNFEMDYWGLSYKQGLEYLLKREAGNEVRLIPEHPPGLDNRLNFEQGDRARLKYLSNFYEPGIYFLSDQRAKFGLDLKVKTELVHQIETPSGPVLRIYKTLEEHKQRAVIYTEENNFENENEFQFFEGAPSGNYVDKVSIQRQYGYNVNFIVDSAYLNGQPAIEVNADLRCETRDPEIVFVASVGRNDQNIYWRGASLGFIFDKTNQWYNWSWGYDLSDAKLQVGDKVSLYLWSVKGAVVYEDNLKVKFVTYNEN